MNTKTIFCAKCQAETDHTLRIERNGEIVAECAAPDCDRFLKFPALPPDQLNELITQHKAVNQGQVSVEETERTLQAWANTPPVEPTLSDDSTKAVDERTSE